MSGGYLSKFKLNEVEIKLEGNKLSEIKVVDLNKTAQPIVKEFDLYTLKGVGQGDYSVNKAKFGSLAATDTDGPVKSQRDRRFSINPLLRDPLSIEQEEKRVIEEKVKAQVEILTEEAKRKAAEVGYADGYKKGHDEAYKRFETEGAESLKTLESLMVEFANMKVDLFKANERFFIELVFRIGKMILLKELATDEQYILRLAKELITRVGLRDNITLRINSDDANTIDLLKEGLLKTFGQLPNLNIEASDQVKRGECVVETQWNTIDASIEKQLEGVHNALIGKHTVGGGI